MSTRKYQFTIGVIADRWRGCSKPPVQAPAVCRSRSRRRRRSPRPSPSSRTASSSRCRPWRSRPRSAARSTRCRSTRATTSRQGRCCFVSTPRPFEAALRQAQATLARDVAQAQNAQRDAERYKALADKDYVTKSQADQAESAADVDAGHRRRPTAPRSTTRGSTSTTPRFEAPISGRTGGLLVRQGNVVEANADPLVVINQLRPITVRFPVIQHDFPELQRRAAQGPVPVRVVTADSGARGGSRARSRSSTTPWIRSPEPSRPRHDSRTRRNELWPGEYVRVSVQLSVQHGRARHSDARRCSPVRRGATCSSSVPTRRPRFGQCPTGRAVGDMTTIDKGLEAGERVVVDGQSRLTPNAKVDAKPAPTATAMQDRSAGETEP